LSLVFDIDPYIAFIIGLGFLVSLQQQPERATVLTAAALGIYLALQTAFYQRTSAIGVAYAERRGIKHTAQVYALPQPFLPFTWKVIVVHDDHYWVSYVNYLAQKTADNPRDHDFPWSVLVAYRSKDTLRWREYRHFGASKVTQSLARQVWRQNRFAAFRQFAALPALYRVDRDKKGEVCVWFTDLRHNFPMLSPSFRYGMCRDAPGTPWRLYRLRYFRKNDRQVL
jgi:inner membrane protein